MDIHLRCLKFSCLQRYIKHCGQEGKNILIVLAIAGILTGILVFGIIKIQKAKAESFPNPPFVLELLITQENCLLPVSDPSLPEPQIIQRVKMVITAYSSTTWQTDDSPYTTASGTTVKQGTIANNMLAFGTKVRIPELYGDKIFVVEDRMHRRKGYYHLDIWFPEYYQAKNFGAKRAYIEVLKN